MADEAGKEAAIKQRIISHMNKDHQDSLVRYLRYYCSLSYFSARNAFLEDITFSELVVSSSPGSKHHIPLKPAMINWSDARPRVVAMDHECADKLGLSNITVKTYLKPYGFMLFMIILTVSVSTVFSRRVNFEAGSPLYDFVLRYVPQFANFCWTVQPIMVPFIVTVHSAETLWLIRTRLSKHSVIPGSLLWWKWVCDSMLGGGGALYRFDKIVCEEEIRRASAKH